MLATRMNDLGTETAFEVFAQAKTLEAQGKDVIHLEIGEHFIKVDLSRYSDKSFPKIPLYWKLAVLVEIY